MWFIIFPPAHTHTHTHTQHAELTPDFQQYLDDQGLTEVQVVREAVPIIFWVLSK